MVMLGTRIFNKRQVSPSEGHVDDRCGNFSDICHISIVFFFFLVIFFFRIWSRAPEFAIRGSLGCPYTEQSA